MFYISTSQHNFVCPENCFQNKKKKEKKKKRKKEECLSRCPGYRGLVIEMINQNLLDTVVGLFVI